MKWKALVYELLVHFCRFISAEKSHDQDVCLLWNCFTKVQNNEELPIKEVEKLRKYDIQQNTY